MRCRARYSCCFAMACVCTGCFAETFPLQVKVQNAEADMPCPAGRPAPVLLLAVERRVCFTTKNLALR